MLSQEPLPPGRLRRDLPRDLRNGLPALPPPRPGAGATPAPPPSPTTSTASSTRRPIHGPADFGARACLEVVAPAARHGGAGGRLRGPAGAQLPAPALRGWRHAEAEQARRAGNATAPSPSPRPRPRPAVGPSSCRRRLLLERGATLCEGGRLCDRAALARSHPGDDAGGTRPPLESLGAPARRRLAGATCTRSSRPTSTPTRSPPRLRRPTARRSPSPWIGASGCTRANPAIPSPRSARRSCCPAKCCTYRGTRHGLRRGCPDGQRGPGSVVARQFGHRADDSAFVRPADGYAVPRRARPCSSASTTIRPGCSSRPRASRWPGRCLTRGRLARRPSARTAVAAHRHEDGQVRLWSLPAGKLERTFVGHAGQITSLAFHASSSRSSRRVTIAWRWSGTAERARNAWTFARTSTSPPSPSTRRLPLFATASDDGRVRFWDLDTA